MNVTFDCPQCDQGVRTEVAPRASSVSCSHCRAQLRFPDGAWHETPEGDRLERCLVCPSTDLFVRKDFPQRLGVAVVAFGIITSTIAYAYGQLALTFGFLFLSAAMDFLLYHLVGQALVCYRCLAHYRGLAGLDSHAPFNLETHERYRQQKARLATAQQSTSRNSR